MVSQKGALYDDDSRNRGDKSFSDKSQGSKTTNASSLATAVSDSANGDGIELVAGFCRARTQARKYNDCWVICTGPVHVSVQGIRARERRETWENQASILRCTKRGVIRRSASWKTP
jgi:hypothetical protein